MIYVGFIIHVLRLRKQREEVSYINYLIKQSYNQLYEHSFLTVDVFVDHLIALVDDAWLLLLLLGSRRTRRPVDLDSLASSGFCSVGRVELSSELFVFFQILDKSQLKSKLIVYHIGNGLSSVLQGFFEMLSGNFGDWVSGHLDFLSRVQSLSSLSSSFSFNRLI